MGPRKLYHPEVWLAKQVRDADGHVKPSSVRTFAEFLKIPVSTVHLHQATSLNMKSSHFKWIPLFLDDNLRAKRSEGAQQFLDVLQA
jgi:hypothetical protein